MPQTTQARHNVEARLVCRRQHEVICHSLCDLWTHACEPILATLELANIGGFVIIISLVPIVSGSPFATSFKSLYPKTTSIFNFYLFPFMFPSVPSGPFDSSLYTSFNSLDAPDANHPPSSDQDHPLEFDHDTSVLCTTFHPSSPSLTSSIRQWRCTAVSRADQHRAVTGNNKIRLPSLQTFHPPGLPPRSPHRRTIGD